MISYERSKKILKKAKIKIKDEIINSVNSLNRLVSRNIYSGINYPTGDNAAFDGFVSGVFVVLGWILGLVLKIFWSFLGTFCDMAKTRKIARRVRESTKIEGWGDHKWRPNQKKSHRKQIPKLKREIIPKWTKNGGRMELKWS